MNYPQGHNDYQSFTGSIFWNCFTLFKGSTLAATCLHFIDPYVRSIVNQLIVLGFSECSIFVIGTLVVHEILYSLNTILLLEPTWAAPYKIQRRPGQAAPAALTRKAIIKSLASHLTVQPIVLYMLYPIFVSFGSKLRSPLPEFFNSVGLLAICQLSECFLFYVTHRAFHTPALYSFHKQHHEFSGPNGFAAEYAHPLEQLFGNYLSVVTAPLLLGVHTELWWVYLDKPE
jgi:sterol desaturase/sphingolipid hydroxylase (fatty acid hydroxylase superfamily)